MRVISEREYNRRMLETYYNVIPRRIDAAARATERLAHLIEEVVG